MSKDDKVSHRERAEQERQKARDATDTSGKRTHELLAQIYDEKADGYLDWLQVHGGKSSGKGGDSDGHAS